MHKTIFYIKKDTLLAAMVTVSNEAYSNPWLPNVQYHYLFAGLKITRNDLYPNIKLIPYIPYSLFCVRNLAS